MKGQISNQPHGAGPQYMRPISVDRIREAVRCSGRSLWIGALSFEDRCTGSLLKLRSMDARLTDGILINYETSIIPPSEGESRLAQNRSRSTELADGLIENGLRSITLSPYVFGDIRQVTDVADEASGYDLLILDISCITKVHAMALAAFLALDTDRPAIVAYSIPENYGFLDELLESHAGWSDVILAPFSESATLLYETSGRGIIIPGHEAHRLIVAVGELEPAGGRILLAEQIGRPDLKQLSLRRNRRLLGQFARMQSSKWEKRVVDVLDPMTVEKELDELVKEVRPLNAPLFLFPFGPKPVIFTCSLWLSAEYPEASWFVYPVPVSYDVNYSFGLQGVSWFSARGHLKTEWS